MTLTPGPNGTTSPAPSGAGLVLVTGATGYVGGRLVPRLLADGRRVRCLVRDPERIQGRDWATRVQVARGDVLRGDGVAAALAGVEVAYYLVHSMAGGPGFHERDVTAARAFGRAAADAGVRRLVYLGGLGDPDADLSRHLRSRQESGEALRDGGVPVTEFRAAVVVGAGSVSFEMIRYLTERLPVMVCPRWVYTRVQPIAVDDLLDYLAAAPGTPDSAGRIVEIGGEDVLTYGDMMRGYAHERGLHRHLQPVPVLTPLLSSYWVHLVTPVPSAMARPLIEGLRNETVVRDDAAARLFPQVRPMSYAAGVRRAVANLHTGAVETSWADALASSGAAASSVMLSTEDGMIVERRRRYVAAPPSRVFAACCALGGRRGYGVYAWAWRVRGAVDRLAGGVGLRRGRRDPRELRVGDALDFWRVEALEAPRLLRLRAEMKMPGSAWLQFETVPDGAGTQLVQTAYFAPRGLGGLAYWYGLYPVHGRIFSGMIAALAREAGSGVASMGVEG
jgi:uncharacterized protein YbjT (DUF2867 family)